MTKSKNSPHQNTEAYKHRGSTRPNNPTQETERFLDESDKKSVQYEPNIREVEAPRLAWKRTKPDSFSRKAGPLYIHEKIDPSVFLEQLEGKLNNLSQTLMLFPNLPEEAIFECYRYSGGWSNRLIHGDSAQIMASLASKENLEGQVQMVYFDPPYGISFNSNMQVQTNSISQPKKGGGRAGVSPEPEMVRVFRDTYKNGIHDYLDGIRENAVLARNLLTESGSIFLQIGSNNVHRLAVLLDEVFGENNRVATITFCKTGSSSSETLSEVSDYLLWYAKDKTKVKFQNLFKPLRNRKEILDAMGYYAMLEDKDGTTRNLTAEERKNPEIIPPSLRIFRRLPLNSQHHSATRSEPFEWNGKVFHCPSNTQWSVSYAGLNNLGKKNRLITSSKGIHLGWKQYESEMPGTKVNNVWEPSKPSDKHYVVETSTLVVERCILMSTDPGDLVLDLTCGSGTTPYVAESWGRRWIALDASRVPIALTRQRILSAVYDWYVLKNSTEGRKLELSQDTGNNRALIDSPNLSKDPASGFVYKKVPYVSAANLAYDKPPGFTSLVDKPYKSRGKKRISSAFTVESHSPYKTVSPDEYLSEDMSREAQEFIIEALRTSGVNLLDGRKYFVQDIEQVSYFDHAYISHLCNIRQKDVDTTDLTQIALSILPDDASCNQGWITNAIRKTAALRSPKMVLVIAFNYDSDAMVDTPTIVGNVTAVCLRANRDLMISNLEHTKYDSAFVQIGEPEILIEEVDENNITVEVKGFDTFDPQSGNLKNGNIKDIDCWMLDTNYDQTAFMARRVHFPNGENQKQLKRYKIALKAIVDESEWESMLSNKSSAFERPRTGRIAVRIITTTAVEMTTVRSV